MKLNIKARESSVVKPSGETAKKSLWNSNVDLVMPKSHTPSIYFYKHDGSTNFFDAGLLKDALGKALVAFYPMAGRLKMGEDGRIEIDCNGDGVLFIDAEADCALEDFGDFAPMQSHPLIPKVDCYGKLSDYPLLAVQVTHFKCGGVSMGVSLHHQAADATSGIHFINTWSDMARGLQLPLPPFIDRTLLRARDPPSQSFHHIEYDPPPTLITAPTSDGTIKISNFKITRDQINLLKSKAKLETENSNLSYTSFEALAAHMWRCACKARELLDDQETKLFMPIDGRTRFRPMLPPGYFGNVILAATPIAVAGELRSKPLGFAAQKIREALAQRNDAYLRSAVDFLEMQPDPQDVAMRAYSFSSPNLMINSWVRAPIYEADFGWGRPIHMGPGQVPIEGLGFIQPSPVNDGSLFVVISLQLDEMARFEKAIYEI